MMNNANQESASLEQKQEQWLLQQQVLCVFLVGLCQCYNGYRRVCHG